MAGGCFRQRRLDWLLEKGPCSENVLTNSPTPFNSATPILRREKQRQEVFSDYDLPTRNADVVDEGEASGLLRGS